MRNEFPQSVKKSAWKRCEHKGRHYCEECDQEFITNVMTPEYDHDNPDFLGGKNDLKNCKVRCPPCHKRKTAKLDRPAIDKTKRILNRAAGLHKPKGRPMTGTKASGVRKRFDGTVESW